MTNDKIKSQGTKVEKTPQMSDGLKVHTKSLIIPQTLQILYIQSLIFFQFKFDIKIYFLVPGLRDEKWRDP